MIRTEAVVLVSCLTEFEVDRTMRGASKIIDIIRRVGNSASRLGLAAAAASLLLVVAINFVNVVLRYVFFHPLAWAEELMLYLSIFSVYAGAVVVAWEQRHIRLDGILQIAPLRFRLGLEMLASMVAIGILVPVIYSSVTVVSLLASFGEHSDALQVPMWIPQSVIPIALLLIVLAMLIRIFAPDLAPRKDDLDDFAA